MTWFISIFQLIFPTFISINVQSSVRDAAVHFHSIILQIRSENRLFSIVTSIGSFWMKNVYLTPFYWCNVLICMAVTVIIFNVFSYAINTTAMNEFRRWPLNKYSIYAISKRHTRISFLLRHSTDSKTTRNNIFQPISHRAIVNRSARARKEN